ncbi:MAG TPA: type I DNA topoisomerase [Chlamydiales bacterium]|nr:type I DNA topoisomerase [Chlamydiales bacterium]
MGKALVIVESPAKIKTLKKFLGPHYIFESSIGHIRDLPQKEFGIDVENDFEPKYVTLADKKEVIKKLQDAAKKADIVYLSPDPDREGEAIAWHIASILPKGTKYKRTPFQSITKDAVQEALEHPRDIDMDLVNAQQTRRLLDRIVGYKISPILTRKVKRGRHGSSAGRVQSVALKLVVDREKAIDAFIPVEYWNISTLLQPKTGDRTFPALLFSVNELRVEKERGNKECFLISDAQTAKQITDKLKKATYRVATVDKKEKKRNPVPPFITSTLQQEASRHYGFSVARTMNIAQGLYEGVDMGPESEGLITYMRTDSVNIAPEAITNARKYILNHFGAEYLPDQPKVYASKKTAQEAHEGIRPTSLARDPEKIRQYLDADQYKLYLLIWRRFIASQMNPAIYDTVSADIDTNQNMVLRATGSVIKFNGYLAAYEEKKDKGAPEEEDENAKILPPLEVNMPLDLRDVISTQSFTKPPPRFTEASLVKELERLGIGRPSTYAAIMNKIQSRDYTVKESQALKPTELGKVICEMLEQNFPPIMDVTFTAQMEDQLEQVAEHNRNWKEILHEFWKDFIPLVEKAEKEAVVPKLVTDIDCPKCGHKLQKIWSRNKYFYGCSNYPDCDFTAPIEALTFNKEDYDANFNWDQTCPTCGSPMTLRHGRFGPFLGCSKYPECKGIVNIPKKGEQVYSSEEMPSCPAIGCDGKLTARKSRFGKTFFSCSNYPDCDVIVSTLDQIEEKYGTTHPKTAYIKKAKRGKFGKKGAEPEKKASKHKIAQPAYKLSSDLSKIVGATELSRPEVTKQVWVYIKKHNLQDPTNKRLIRPDAALAKVFGTKEPIDMLKLATVLNKHLKK